MWSHMNGLLTFDRKIEHTTKTMSLATKLQACESGLLHSHYFHAKVLRDSTSLRSKQLSTVAIPGFQFALYHVVAPLSLLLSISLASLFSSLSIFG